MHPKTSEHNGHQPGIHIQWDDPSHQHQLHTRHIQHGADKPELGITGHSPIPNTTPIPIWQPTTHTEFQQLRPTPREQPQHQPSTGRQHSQHARPASKTTEQSQENLTPGTGDPNCNAIHQQTMGL